MNNGRLRGLLHPLLPVVEDPVGGERVQPRSIGVEILTADAPYKLKDGSLSPVSVQLVDRMPVLKMIVEDFEFELAT
jgi:hypothetical protein